MDTKVKKKKEKAVVLEQREIAGDIYSLWLSLPEAAKEAACGQFLSLFTGDGSRLLPRPISICEIDRSRQALRFVYRVTGEKTGTAHLSRLCGGDTVEVMGPFGNGFDSRRAVGKRAMLVGGGIGVPPMVQLAWDVKGGAAAVTCVMGYRSEPFLIEDFPKEAKLYTASEDGSHGMRGNVLDVIAHLEAEGEAPPDILYACGPAPMLRALARYADEKGITCYVSLEERMACGIGACLACVCKTKEKDGHTHVHNTRICSEGPVFLSTEVEL